MSTAQGFADAQKNEAIKNIANVSSLLRKAISAAIPVAPEQYLAVAIPGTVIDTRDVPEGGTLVYDATKPFIPTSVRQEEARLVDKMVPLASVMIGNTGKSVARSYSRALDCLLPRKVEVKDSDGNVRSPGSDMYNDSMSKLKAKDPQTGLTPVDIYIQKQAAWADAQSQWDEAKVAAQAAAMSNPDNIGKDGNIDRVKVQQEFNDWNQAHFRKYKYAVQGRYMDWVANGNKYEVENDFGIVDVDSIMARVEDSKESMRNSTIVDADGSNELHIVNLTPRDWATTCMQRAKGWWTKNGDFTANQIDAEILRLQQLKLSFQAMESSTVTPGSGGITYPMGAVTNPLEAGASDNDVQNAIADVYKARGDLNKDIAAKRSSGTAGPPAAALEAALKTKEDALRKATIAHREYHAEKAKADVAQMTGENKTKLADWITAQKTDIDNQITGLQAQKANKFGSQTVALPVVQPPSSAQQTLSAQPAPAGQSPASTGDGSPDAADSSDIAGPGATKAAPIFGLQENGSLPSTTTPTQPQRADPWTTISASFKATQQTQSTDTSSWGMSVGGHAGFGLWSAGGSYAHDESKSDSTSDMASCDVSVSFAAMVVNIDRPWLYAELFNDYDLDVAKDVLISPGAESLRAMMLQQAQQDTNGNKTSQAQNASAYLAQYASFPAFPTSFLVAADTTVEFTGNTSHIETHFSSQSNSGSASVGWGPFSVSSSFHQASSHSNFQMQTTATGVRLCFGAPQIIGWVNQMLPELPRVSGYEPMIQNNKPNISNPVGPTL